MQENLDLWQARLISAQNFYKDDIQKSIWRDELYQGTKEIRQIGSVKPKNSGNVRNIVYELIESEVNAAIPVVKVNANNQASAQNAALAEALLRSEIKKLPMSAINDEDERLCCVQGSSAYLVEWETQSFSHTAMGGLAISLLHPSRLLVQPGAQSIQKAQWIIVEHTKTRGELAKRYKNTPDGEADDILQVYVGYFRNEQNGIGRSVWISDLMLECLDDYEALHIFKCKKCGQISAADFCEECKSKSEQIDYEVLSHDITLQSGEKMHRNDKVPIYTPRRFPIVLRKNVSAYGKLFGESDVDKIADQQEAIKKLGTKIDEKILKGGSYVTLPAGVTVETSDKELKILRVKSPADKAMIDVYNIQPDVSKDRASLEENYQWAKSTLGITDAYQGKRDATATSGVAKQFAATQSAGRLESKNVMKNAAYSELFSLMFSFLLAYSEDYCDVAMQNIDGSSEYKSFCKYDFLRKDLTGEVYWDDDLSFEVDVGGTMANNRQAMWQEMRQSFTMGAFGEISSVQAQMLFWQVMEDLNYPMAGVIRASLTNQTQKDMQNINTQEMLKNVMPILQNGNEN